MPQPEIDDQALDLLASIMGIDLPASGRPGVRANLALLRSHAELVRGADEHGADPAELLRP